MIADAIVLAVVVISIAIGYRTGFFKSLIKVASYIVSIVLSFFFYPILSDFLMKTPIYPFLVEKINENYLSPGTFSADGKVGGFLSDYLNRGIENVAEGMSGAFAGLLINILSFIIIVIVFKILIKIVTNALNIFTRLPVIKQFNRFGGAVVGGLIGVLVLYLAFALLVVVSPLKSDGRIMEEIEKSSLASEMYYNNFLIEFLDKEGKA